MDILAVRTSARPRSSSAVVALAVGVAGWLWLVCWELTSVPGMSMDEGWFILSSRGQWPSANPLSGMTPYTANFPALLLRLFQGIPALLVLRGVGLIANTAMLIAIGRMLWRSAPNGGGVVLGLAACATSPAWLILMRTGIEITMLTPPLCVLGFYLLARGGRWASGLGGLAWGLVIYNHLLGAWAVASLAVAWLIVHRRLPRIAWVPACTGFALGLAPRAVSLARYGSQQMGDMVASLSPKLILGDLLLIPQMFWDTWLGRTVYLRYTGHISLPVWPYWGLTALLFIPWAITRTRLPRTPCFVFVALLSFCICTPLGAPYISPRYLMLAVIGGGAFVAAMAAATTDRFPSFTPLVAGVTGLIVSCNVFYWINNFYLPWERGELRSTSYRLGLRSPPLGSWHFLPKQGLARHLRDLAPSPEQIITNASLRRPLWAMLDQDNILTPRQALRKPNSVLVDYARSKIPQEKCHQLKDGEQCFHAPVIVDRYFVVYH